MGKLEEVLRSEILRLARKEMRAACVPLAKEVRELKRTVRELSRALAALGTQEGEGGEAPVVAKLEADPKDVEKARFSPGLCRKLRKRLAITQGQLAALIDVSPTTVAFWEQGRNRPTDASLSALVALRKCGRRDVKRLLEAKGALETT